MKRFAMIVYGKKKKKYVLSQNPVSRDYDGAVYSVSGNQDILIKIYQPEYRTPETEKLVIDTANGRCSMLDENPVDVVYANGRFAGYIFETSAPDLPVEAPLEIQPVRREGLSTPLAALICIAASVLLSALVYFVIFDKLRPIVGEPYGFWNFNGIPMILGGWVCMGLSLFYFQQKGGLTAVLGVLGFLVGAAVVFLAVSLLVWLIITAWSIVKLVLPAVVTVAALVWVVKSVFGKRW